MAADDLDPTAPLSPEHLDPVLLGICHWMGYRTQLYPHHPLTEGALVAELAGLLRSHLPSELSLVLEQPYSTLGGGGPIRSGGRGRPSAVDIAIGPRASLSRRNSGSRKVVHPTVAIEVKRSQLGDWEADLKKLADVWKASTWTAWVLLLDQRVAADHAEKMGWVGANGRASRRPHASRDAVPYVVRRVKHVQSAHARRVHRAVLLELVGPVGSARSSPTGRARGASA